jgi:glutamate-1-semialdehyde 2,1-aminomutase
MAVNSPVRACKSVGADPLFIRKAEGAVIVDADGNRYIDFIGSWGPMILGHNHPAVVKAVRKVLERGMSFGAPTDLEIELAQMVIAEVPSVEMVRMVNSGTEAAMSAIRLRARSDSVAIRRLLSWPRGHPAGGGRGVATLGFPKPRCAKVRGGPHRRCRITTSLASRRLRPSRGIRSPASCEPVAGNMGPGPGSRFRRRAPLCTSTAPC